MTFLRAWRYFASLASFHDAEFALCAIGPLGLFAAIDLARRGALPCFVHGPAGRYDLGGRRSRRRVSAHQMHSYQVAKLAVTAWIYSLSRRWAGSGVTANLLDPGMVKGEIGEHFEGPLVMRVLMNHVFPFFLATGKERGSEQYVRLTTDPALENVSGTYFASGKEKKDGGSQLARDPAVQKIINDVAESWAEPFYATSLLK